MSRVASRGRSLPFAGLEARLASGDAVAFHTPIKGVLEQSLS